MANLKVQQRNWKQEAIETARAMAYDFMPVTERQALVQDRILSSCQQGDLSLVMEAMVGARLYATKQWRDWHDGWLRMVQRYLFSDQTATKIAA